ncbi:hypothetical protein Gogos_003016 [Gossypium gossypioides]|uniref:Exocyst subunit Exo70 family protein n=1 Tax=Gossypium gossypioides TaxID=34282 RepID=A0A7J9CKP1_GOSGO|nr:hypothetical protein [Gossypium gossypioides]
MEKDEKSSSFKMADGDESKSEVDNKEEKAAADEKEEPEGTETDRTETEETPQEAENEGGEPEEPTPPPYTLETAFEDIEHFLSNLSTILKEKEEEKIEKEKKKKEEEEEKEKKKKKEEEEKKEEEDENEEEDGKEKEEEGKEEKKEEEKEEVEDEGLEIPEFIEKYLDLLEEKISKLESTAAETKVKGQQPPEHDPLFFKVVRQILKLYKDLSAPIKPESKQGPLINRICGIHFRALCYLEDEFKYLLEELRNVEPDPKQEVAAATAADQGTEAGEGEDKPAEESKLQEYSDQVLAYMNKIAMEMISGGHEFECREIYMTCRMHIIGETLKNLGFEKISIDDAQKMPWELLERDIPPWITIFKQCANVHFPAERKLAETIFSGHPSFYETIITNLARGLFIQFLNFPEAAAFCKLTTEKLFKFLDMYEALRDNLFAIDSVFPQECANELRTETTTCRCRIGESAICIFCDLENSIKSDTGKTPVAGGAVHPLTRYIMNYLKYACEYKDTIEQVFKDHSKIERADSTSRPRDYESRSLKYKKNDAGEDRPPFQEQLMRIMDLLDSAIEAKSKLYKDISLSCIFMMNNGRYMLQKIKGTVELHKVVGDNWCRKRSSDVRNYHKSYQRETWTKLLGCISNDGLNVRGKVVKPVLKEKFKSFNAMFDEIHRTQSTWVVYDKQLQSELRVSIASVVIPAYRSFLGRYSQYLDPGRQTEKYIKFQAEDIETYIDDLFDGNPGGKKT